MILYNTINHRILFEFLCSSLFNKLRFQSSHEPKWRTGEAIKINEFKIMTQLDKIFIYHLKQNKLFSFLNVLGLSIGIAG
jgi:hypothetical protein